MFEHVVSDSLVILFYLALSDIKPVNKYNTFMYGQTMTFIPFTSNKSGKTEHH